MDLDLFFSSIPEEITKVIFVGKNDSSSDLALLSKYNSKSLAHSNVYEFSFKDTGYNFADKVIFEKHKDEVSYFLKNNVIEGASDDRVVFLDSDIEVSFGNGASLGLMWCKMSNVDAAVIINPTSKISKISYTKVFNQILNEGKDIVIGRNENKVRTFVKSLNYVLKTILLNLASGYWSHTFINSSCIGFSKDAIARIPIIKLRRSYGFLMDLLIKANLNNCKLVEIFVDDKQEMKTLLNRGHLLLSLKILIFGFLKRLWIKYFFIDFHPLFLFYHFSFILFTVSFYYGGKIIYVLTQEYRELNKMTVFAFLFFSISSIQAFAFSMWMDISDNKKIDE